MRGFETTTLCLLLAFGACAMAGTARAEGPLEKGPWLMDARPDRVTVFFETPTPEAAHVEARTDGAATPVMAEAPAATMHRVVLEGLTPKSRYDYRISLGGGGSVKGHFRTPPPFGTGPVHFVVYGDSRSDAAAHATVVAAIVRDQPSFVVETGDMVVRGSDDHAWDRFFRVEEPLLRDVPFFAAVGNHETYDPGVGLRLSERYVALPADASHPTYYAFSWGSVRFLMLDSNDAWDRGNAQWTWLEHALEAADANPNVHHLFVALHQGPYSSGHHGGDPELAQSGVPEMLRRHGVDLVFAGHDHDYERGEVDGLKYIVTGGAGAPLYPVNRHDPGQLAFATVHHYVDVQVEGERVTIRTVEPDGTLFERCTFTGKGPFVCGGARARHGASPAAGPVEPGQSALSFYASRRRFWLALGTGLLGIAAFVLFGRALARRRRRS